MSTPTTEVTKPTEEKKVVEQPEPMDADQKPEAAETKAEPEQSEAAETKADQEQSEAKSEEKAEDVAEEAEATKSAPSAQADPQKPETFFVETPNTPKKSIEGAKNEVKKKSIQLRPQLMKFPGALRIHCTKTAKEGEYAIVLRIEKPSKPEEFSLPEEFGEIMKLDKDATAARKHEDGFYGEYELTDKSYRIWVKLFDAGKIESLDEPKNVTGRLRNPTKTNSEPVVEADMSEAKTAEETKPAAEETKPTDETKPAEEAKPADDAKPTESETANAEANPDAAEAKPATEEAKPATEEAMPAATEAETKPAETGEAMEAEENNKPEKRPREEAAPEEAPAAKRAKVAEEEAKPSDAAAAAAVC